MALRPILLCCASSLCSFCHEHHRRLLQSSRLFELPVRANLSSIKLHNPPECCYWFTDYCVSKSNIVLIVARYATPDSHQQTEPDRCDVTQQLRRYYCCTVIANLWHNNNDKVVLSYTSDCVTVLVRT
jgi:hypothetical protein